MIDKVVEIAQKASIGVMKIYQENSFNIRNKQHNGKLYIHLRHQGKAYRKRYGYPNNRGAIPNRTDIDQRPLAVNNRLVFGHWEADTIIGKDRQGGIVTLDERVTKLRLAYPVESRHITHMPACYWISQS